MTSPAKLTGPPAARGRVGRRARLGAYLRVLGPGLIASQAGNDAGGIATYSSAGSQFGYRMLFFMLLVAVGLVLVQEMAARLGTFTGKGLAALIREEFSLRVAAFALVCLLIANLGLVVSEFAGIGAAMELFGVSRYLAVPLAAVIVWGLVVLGSYKYAERLFLLMALVFFAYPLAAILAGPDWGTVAAYTFWPHLLGTKAFLFLGVAIIGTTISPYMQLYQAAAVADKGITPDQYRFERVDAISGAIFACLVAFFIIVATGATIGNTGPLDSAAEAARALEPVAGHQAEALFGIGLLGASALAAAVVPLSTAYALSEAIGAERSVSRSFRQAPLFLGLFSGQIAVGAAVALVPGNLISLLINAYVLNGLITPIVLTFLVVLTSRQRLLGPATNRPLFRAVATAVVAVVSVLSTVVLVQTLLSWVGIG
jgi:NRAMP (natural resistance-associated macrophage protein)-like metal ion transporter